VCCSVLQCGVVCCSYCQSLRLVSDAVLCWCVCCSMLQCVPVCCSVLQCIAVHCSVLSICCRVFQCVVACSSVLQCVASTSNRSDWSDAVLYWYVCYRLLYTCHIHTHTYIHISRKTSVELTFPECLPDAKSLLQSRATNLFHCNEPAPHSTTHTATPTTIHYSPDAPHESAATLPQSRAWSQNHSPLSPGCVRLQSNLNDEVEILKCQLHSCFKYCFK